MLDDIIVACRELLLSFPLAEKTREYVDNRLSRAAQEEFQFGYFPAHAELNVLVNLVGQEKLSQSGLIYDKMTNDWSNAKDRYGVLEKHNLVMPYRDVYGTTIAIVGRSLLSDQDRRELKVSKYKNTSFGKGMHLFGLFEAKSSIVQKNQAIIVEGQFDVISAHSAGVRNVVAVGGSNLAYEQLALLMRYTDNVLLLFDNDDPGRIGVERALNQFGKRVHLNVGKLPLGYKDLDELVKEFGEDAEMVLTG